VAEFFDLKLRSSHISLMACGSASQKISAGDEPLGILTALLCAGAASIVGTMWPVASASARKFAGLFQSELFDINTSLQRDSVEGSDVEKQVVNLAVALQKAIVRMKQHRDSRLPYHWTPFVLHGSCFMQRPKDWSCIVK
jgi:CHAT domain-containing protein